MDMSEERGTKNEKHVYTEKRGVGFAFSKYSERVFSGLMSWRR